MKISALGLALASLLIAVPAIAGPAPEDVQGAWSDPQCDPTAMRHVIDGTTWAWIEGEKTLYRGEADFEVDEDRLVVTLGRAIDAPKADAGGPQEGDVITYRILPEGLKPISLVRDADTSTYPDDAPVFHRCTE